MAPFQDSGALVGPSQEELEMAMSEMKMHDLVAMALRLTTSMEKMHGYHDEFAREQSQLKEENLQLQETVGLFVQQTMKLNIGSSNIVDPQIEEGPLNFIGRYWERVRPRANIVIVNEHLGDFNPKCPAASSSRSSGTHVGSYVAQDSVIGVLLAEWFPGPALFQPETTKLAECWQSGSVAALGSCLTTLSDKSVFGWSKSTPETVISPVVIWPAAPFLEPFVSGHVAETPQEEDPVSYSIVIEVLIDLGDGSTQPLQVRSVDRCTDAAARFVCDHSLKGYFEEPLTAYLRVLENQASTYPVKAEAELLEIRRLHSTKTTSSRSLVCNE